MKSYNWWALLILAVAPVWGQKIRSGEDLVAAMHKKYESKWYKTLTFVQKTTNYQADGTSQISNWYEALSLPGKLRIYFAPLEQNNGLIFADGVLHSFRGGKLNRSQPFLHPLLILGFDIYHQPVQKTIAQVKDLKIDLLSIREDKWNGKSVYVVGAKQGDMQVPQFWIDKKNLYFVRLIEIKGKDKKSVHETQFNKYQKIKSGGWLSTEVLIFVDGKKATTEEYTDIQTEIPLNSDLFDPQKWTLVERNYFQKR